MAGFKKETNKKKKQLNNASGRTDAVDKTYRKFERSSRFWNKIDPANKFRHWYLGKASLTRSLFRVVAAWQTIVILTSALVILYILSAFYTGKGEFVIKLDRPMAAEGFVLAESQDFSDFLVTLRNDAVKDATNISIYDIAGDVMEVDGKHNGANYVAYTFYLKNKTSQEHDYHYELSVQSTSKNADSATWVMLFVNGEQQIFAQENAGGYPEYLYSKWEFPFMEFAKHKGVQSVVENADNTHITDEMIEYHEFTKLEGLYELKTTPWQSKDLVCTGNRQNMQVDDVDKYTVVIWPEGDDPDCKDEILGGHVEMTMRFMY